MRLPINFNWDLGRWIIVVYCNPIKSTYFSSFRMKNEQAPLLLHLFPNARKEKRHGSFLILIGAKYFCSTLNTLLATLVQSRWLDIASFYCVSLITDNLSRSMKTQKRLNSAISSHLTWLHAWSIAHMPCYLLRFVPSGTIGTSTL